MRTPLLLQVLLVPIYLAACKPPPEVPDATAEQPSLEELCLSMFEQLLDEDTAPMEQGVLDLTTWLDLYELETREGYQVGALSAAVVKALDGSERATEGMLGVVVGSQSAFSVEDAAYAMVAVDQEEIHASRYEGYEVEYLSDLDCFLARSCPRLELLEDYTANFVMGVSSTNHTHNQYLWLDTDAGLAMAHRAWLPEPPETNFSWLAVDEQFYLDLFIPWPDGHFRVQTTWMVYDQEVVGEDVVMGLVISGMQEHSEALEEWLGGE